MSYKLIINGYQKDNPKLQLTANIANPIPSSLQAPLVNHIVGSELVEQIYALINLERKCITDRKELMVEARNRLTQFQFANGNTISAATDCIMATHPELFL
jgi:hypothetical protein